MILYLVLILICSIFSEAFYEPVPWRELNLLDYIGIVHEPMDFSTVKKNLLNGQYDTAKQFENDVNLIWYV